MRREIEEKRLLWSSQERSTKEGELRDLEAALATLRNNKFGPNGEFERLYQELMAPVLDLMMVAVQAEAEAQKYDYVFDKSSRGMPMLYSAAQHDITLAVLDRLGVEVDASELEARPEKKNSILPENFPVQLEVDGKSPISLDPGNSSMSPQFNPSVKVENGTQTNPSEMTTPPVQQERKVETNPNELLDPDEREEGDPR